MKQRKLNVKVLVGLIVGAVLSVIGVAILNYFQVSRKADQLLTLAAQARDEGDLQQAKSHLTRYVQFRPDDYSGYATLAIVLTDLAESPDAQFQDQNIAWTILERAVRKIPEDAPEQLDVRRRLVDFTMKVRFYKAALDHLDYLLERLPNDVELNAQYGQCLLRTRDYTRAIEVLSRTVGFDPQEGKFQDTVAIGVNHVQAYVELASALRQHHKKPEFAETVMDRVVEANPDSAEAFLARGRYRRREEDLERAKADVAKARELAPEDVEVLLTSAEIAIEEEDFAAAKAALQLGVEKHAEEPRFYRALALFEITHGQREDSLKYVRNGLEAIPGNATLLVLLADLELQAGNLDAVRQAASAMQRANVRKDLLDYLDARILMFEGKWLDAARQLEPLRTAMAGQSSGVLRLDLLAGQCYEYIGQHDRALKCYLRARATNPNSATVQSGIRRMRILMGQAQADQTNPLQAWVTEQLDQLAETGDWSGFDEWFDGFAETAGYSDEQRETVRDQILIQRELTAAQMFARREQFSDAWKRIDVASKSHPDVAGVPIAAAQLAMQDPERTFEQSMAILDKAQDKLGDSLTLRLAKARIIAQGRPAELQQKLAALEQGLDEFNDDEQLQMRAGMARAYYQAGLKDDARRCWIQIAKTRPNNLKIRRQLFELALELGNPQYVQEAVDEVLAAVGSEDDSLWQYCEAARLVFLVQRGQEDKERLVEAQQLVEKARRSRPDWYDVYRIQGHIHKLEGNADSAIENFERALELGPPSTIVVNSLMELLTSKGRADEARQLREKYFSRGRGQAGAEGSDGPSNAAELADQAVAIAQERVTRDPDNPLTHIYLGQALLQAREVDKAEEALRRALEISPALPEGWMALIALLAGNERMADAEAELRKAQVHLTEDRLPLVMAQCSQIVGRVQDAERYFLTAYRAAPNNIPVARALARFYLSSNTRGLGGVDKATPYINEILRSADEPDSAASPHVHWARQRAAEIFATRGTYDDTLRALSILQKNTIDGKLSLGDQLLKANILAARPELQSRREAIRLYQGVQEKGALGPRESLSLAKLLHATGEWGACQSEMVALINQLPSDTSILATYCRMLLDRGKTDQAEQQHAKLAKLDPKGSETVQIKAWIQARKGQLRPAVNTLVSQLPAQPRPNDIPQIKEAARVLSVMGQQSEVERLFRLCAQVDPREKLALASYLGRRGDLEEAFRLFEETRRDHALVQVLQAATTAISLQRRSVGDKYDEQIQKWFDEALREYPDSTALLLELVRFREAQSAFDELESLYTKLVARDDLDDTNRAAILNNAAFFLALNGTGDEKALNYIDQAIRILGPTGDLLDTRAMVRLAGGDFQGAVKDMTVALAESEHAVKYFHLALAHQATGDRQSATASLTKARQLGLNADAVHPLEREKYERLIADLGAEQARRAG